MAFDIGQVLGGILGGGGINQEAITAILAALTAAAGSQGTPFSETGKTSSTGNVATGTTSTSNPNLNPAVTGLISQLSAAYPNLTQGPNLAGLQAQNIQSINANSDAAKEAIRNEMASRGLSTSPAAATAEANLEQNRVNQITQMQEQLPLQQYQNRLAAMQQAGQFATSIPYGTGVNTNGNQSSTQNGSSDLSGSQGGGLGGLLGGLAGILALASQAGKNNNPYGPPYNYPQQNGGSGNNSPSDTNTQGPITITIYNKDGSPSQVTIPSSSSTTSPSVGGSTVGGWPGVRPLPVRTPIPGISSDVTYPSTTTLDPGNLYPPGVPIDPNVPVTNPPGAFDFSGGTGGIYGGTGGNGNPLGMITPGENGYPPSGYGDFTGQYGDPTIGGFSGDAARTLTNNSAYNLAMARTPTRLQPPPIGQTQQPPSTQQAPQIGPLNFAAFSNAFGPNPQQSNPQQSYIQTNGIPPSPLNQNNFSDFASFYRSHFPQQPPQSAPQQPVTPISSVFNQDTINRSTAQGNPAASVLSNFNGNYAQLASQLAGIYAPTSLLGQQMASLSKMDPSQITPYMQQQLLNNISSPGTDPLAGPVHNVPNINPGGVLAGAGQSLYYPGGGNPLVIPTAAMPLYGMPVPGGRVN